MAQASYSFLDVAALDEVRQRFAAGDALVILSGDLEEVIWANGPGAALFGHADVDTALGTEAPLGAAAKRQIAATSGFPDIGRDRALLVRIATGVSSRAQQFLASALTLPDGEEAILLTQPAAADGAAEVSTGTQNAAERAIGGFAAAGHFLAFVDAEGAVEAASAGFARLGLTQEALAGMAHEADEEQRIVKRMLPGRRGPLPAGLARLTADRHLLVVIDEQGAEDEEPAEPQAVGTIDIGTAADDAAETEQTVAPQHAAEPAREIWYLGSASDPLVVAAGLQDPAAEEPMQAEPGDVQAEVEPELPAEVEPTTAAESASEPEATAPEAAEPVAAVQEAAPQPAQPETAPQEPATVKRATGPVRFVWRTDADGKFSQISPEFAHAVGELAADIVGRRFQDVANAFGLDPTGEIAGLLGRRDTWSGRSVGWPVAGTDLKMPVDLAALPVYDRNRNFEGFRGFGVARTGDVAADPEGIGLVLVRLPEATEPAQQEPETEARNTEEDTGVEEPTAEAGKAEPPEETDAAGEAPADPFHGEKPALSVTPAPDRRFSDKVIRLAEHRPAANDRGPNGNAAERSLSAGERIAFQQIGERLKKESGTSTLETAKGSEPAPAEPTEAKKPQTGTGGPPTDARQMEPTAGDRPAVDEPDETIAEADDVAELEALDGVTDAGSPEQTADAAGETAEAAEAETAWAPEAVEAPQEPAAEAQQEPRARRAGRPGMSLLDFAEWGKDEPAAQDTRPKPVALVEMEEAAALDERAPPVPAAEEIAAAEAGTAAIGQVESEPVVQAEAEPVEVETQQAEVESAEQDAGGAEETVVSPARDVPADTGSGLSILEKLPVPVLVHSGDRLHYANDEFFALTGYRSVEELAQAGGIGALFADPYEDDAEEEPQQKADRHMRLKTRDGNEFPVEAFLQSVPWNGGKALLLVLSRAGEGFGGQSPLIAELEARVAEMRTIIDTATDGVVLMSRDGNIRSISRPAEALFGMDSDDVAGKPFFSLFAIESQKAARDYLNGLSDHGVASILNDGREVIGREAEGRFIPLFMTIGRLPGESGYCAVVRDITQWKRAEEELTQARATAERSSSHKTEFLARVSHEIRTPLNAIIGFSELMLDEKFGPVANDRYRDYLRDINRSGNHVLDLVNDLLDISKIEAGQQEMSYEAVSLNETLAETVALMQPQANRERVIIRSSFASKLPDVVADLRSVRQIALNILSNAVRYTQAGGQVIVSTAYEPGGEVVMRVRDTGIGMTPAEIEQALKPFKQINSLKRARGDGTGLGLPLTKAMVEANRAKFTINSTPGEGTLVEVAFPSTRVLAD